MLIGNRLLLSATDTGRVVPGLEQAFPVHWTPDGNQLYVMGPAPRTLTRFDPATGRRAELFKIGPFPFGDQLIGFGIGDNPELYGYTIWHFTSQLHVVDGIR